MGEGGEGMSQGDVYAFLRQHGPATASDIAPHVDCTIKKVHTALQRMRRHHEVVVLREKEPRRGGGWVPALYDIAGAGR